MTEPLPPPDRPRLTWRLAAVVVARGLRRRCPQCGRQPLFHGWYTLADRCESCDLEVEAYEGSSWAFMYITTAFLTGLFILVLVFYRPAHTIAWRVGLIIGAFVVILGSLPYRKGMAVALDYLSELCWNNDRGLRIRESPPEDEG
jgi:uncharacterized protein (DUF983 family)